MKTRIFKAASRAAYLALATSLFVTSAAHAQDWINLGEGDWFDPANWSTAAVPTASTDAAINNGGTAVLGEDSDETEVRSLSVGVDGGEGTLSFQGFDGRRFRIEDRVEIGVTNSGSQASNGSLVVDGLDRDLNLLPTNSSVPFRLGVSSAAGAADGRFIAPDSFRSVTFFFGSSPRFSTVLFGVAEDAGNASALVEAERLQFSEQPRPLPVVEVGVSRGAGQAEGRVDVGQPSAIANLHVGVATGAGEAMGWLRTGERVQQNSALGDARIGVSDGIGAATGVVDLSRFTADDDPSFGPYQQLDIGVSNGSGDASGTVLTATGLSAQTLNLGTSNGSGTGTGLMRNDHGGSEFGTMNLGPGATVVLNAGSNVRGDLAGRSDDYGAIDVDTAVLDGTLIIDFDYIPEGPTRFELINSSSATGLTGDFATVDVRNLNPGLAFTSGIVVDVDSGVEKYVLDLTGTPTQPEWAVPGSGDWFNSGNWSSGSLPDLLQVALIGNGGEARAESSSASSPLRAYRFAVGVDGGSGSLVSNGVDLETVTNLEVGVIRPDHSSGGTSGGQASFTGAELRFDAPQGDDPVPPGVFGRTSSIGAVYTSGSARGALNLRSTDLNLDTVTIGYALIDAADTNAVASSEATLTITDGSRIESFLEMAEARVNADNARATATLEAEISNSSIANIDVGEVEASGTNAVASISAVVSISDSTIDTGLINLAELEADDVGSVASATVELTLERVALQSTDTSGPRLEVLECDAEALDARILPSTLQLDVLDSTISAVGSLFDLDFSEIEADETGQSQCTATIRIVDSELALDVIDLVEADATDSSTANGTAEMSVIGSSLTATRADIGEADPEDDGVAIVDAALFLESTTAAFSESVIVGFYDDDGAAVGNTITARLGLTSSSLETPLLEIGVENPANHPLDAEVSLNPSYLRTDDLQLGPTSRIVLTAEGTTRASPTNLGQPGLYAAIDAGTAQIDGEIIVEIAYSGRTGDVLDVLSTDPGGLTGSNPQISFIGALASAAELETVTENGRDILRLTVLEDIIFQPDTDTPPQAIPINQPLALLLLMLGLAVLGAAALRRG